MYFLSSFSKCLPISQTRCGSFWCLSAELNYFLRFMYAEICSSASPTSMSLVWTALQLYIILRKTNIFILLQSMPKGLVLQVKFPIGLVASVTMMCLKMLCFFFFLNFIFVLKQLMLQRMLIFGQKQYRGSCCGLQGVARKGLVSDSLC